MKFVLDVSVATSWVLDYPLSLQANSLRRDFRRSLHKLIAPSSFPGELASALTKAERQKLITTGEARRLINEVFTTAPVLFPYQDLLFRATDIASQTRSGFYDCLYIALAEQLDCEVLTADQKLVRNVEHQYPFVRSIATYVADSSSG